MNDRMREIIVDGACDAQRVSCYYYKKARIAVELFRLDGDRKYLKAARELQAYAAEEAIDGRLLMDIEP